MELKDILTLAGIPTITMFLFELTVKWLSAKKKKKDNDMVLLKKANQALLRNALLDKGQYYIRKKWIPMTEKDNFSNMYQIYHCLGANGVMDGIYKDVMELPTEQPVNKTKRIIKEG